MTTISSDPTPDAVAATEPCDCCAARAAQTERPADHADHADHDDHAGTAGGSNRRALFRRASMVALAGGGAAALAACGGTSDTSSGGASTSSAPSSASSPSAEASGSSSGSSTTSAAGKPSGTEFAISDVPVGGGVIKDKLVVTQPTSGDFKAFSAVCTHQGCLVNQIQNGLIVCPCHRSMFSIKDGSVSSGPAPSPLPSKQVTASGSDVFVS